MSMRIAGKELAMDFCVRCAVATLETVPIRAGRGFR
jgi:hypothetical protein